MNGEIPSVPIITLAGVTSLTDLLPELPLPTPLPVTMHNKSLLFNPKIADDARRILGSRDESLAQQLVHALKQTSTDHIELKDTLAGDAIEGDIPDLLKMVLSQDPNVFQNRRNFDGHQTRQSISSQQTPTFVPQQQMPTYQSPPHYSSYNSNQNNSQNSTPPRYPQQTSPARFPNSPYTQHGSPFPPNTASTRFQQQFQNFAQIQGPEQNTVNGEDFFLANTGLPTDTLTNNISPVGQAAAGSPAQAAVAEALLHTDMIHEPESANPRLAFDKDRSLSTPRRRSIPSKLNPVVILEQDPTFSLQSPRHSSRSESLRKSMDAAHPPRRLSDCAQNHPSSNLKRPGRSREYSHRRDSRTTAVASNSFGFEHQQRQQQQQRHHEQIPRQKPEEISFSRAVELLVGRNSKPIVVLEPLDPKTLESIATEGRIKTGCDTLKKKGLYRKGYKRRYSGDSYEEEDDEMEEQYYRKKKKKKNKRIHQRPLTVEELLDSPTFKKFATSIESVFDTADEVDFGTLDPNDDETECPPESLISKSVLAEICGEAAKLKSMGVLNQVPADKLVRLLTILQWNVRDGVKLTPNINPDDDEEEQQLWRELTMERVMRSMDSSLTALYIMTAPDMPKQVYLDDVIERIILFGKYQLQNTVYPEFDPVYRIDPNAKDGYHGNLKSKRARAATVKHKSTIMLYNKLCELVGVLAQLLDIQELTDTVILQVSTLGVSPFFVENISELQLNSMKLVTTIFSKYDKHRQLILEDIFASLARLPSSKRNLRNYRLNAEESIQMVTALALQLIQCVIKLPIQEKLMRPESPEGKSSKTRRDTDVVIATSYETAMRTGYNFLSVFLKKCTAKSEDDYRPLFENFVQDLLSTVNKPDWPASEVLLSLLGKILVQQFSNKSVDMSLRVASLEYLGIVAARLRKDAISSQLDQETIDDIVQKVNDDDNSSERRLISEDSSNKSGNQTESLQKSVLEYLSDNAQSEHALLFARCFYIAQWYRDAVMEAEKCKPDRSSSKFRNIGNEPGEERREIMQCTEKRKVFLLAQVSINCKRFSSMRSTVNKLDYEDACLVARYLSSKRPFAQSFDIYLTQILRVLSETAVAVRTKAMKCLTAVVEADPGILARSDMQRGVHGRFLDQSTAVREAAVELVGKFILIRPELIPKYYDMLSDRILDTGISVRKRVIKIFKDICLEQPDFTKIPEMCVKMIRRVNDEEGIKKLVNEVFQTMWFTPLREKDSAKLLKRVVNITDVVAVCKDTGYEFFEQLLENLLKKDEDGNYSKSALQACRQIVDCLVENVLQLEERSVETEDGKGTSSQRLVACLSTLYLFSKIKPDLMVQHATTLQPYLDIKCNTQGDYLVLHNVARILELVVPLMDHPGESFLAQLEEDMMKLILRHGMMVLQSCVSCLGAVVNHVSHNYRLVKDCFQKFFGVLSKLMADHKDNPKNPTLQSRRPTLLRSLFTVGLLCRHFDFDSREMGETKVSIKDRVFDVLLYFTEHEDEDVRHKAITGLGFMCIRHYEFMLGRQLKDLYYHLLSVSGASIKLKCQVLKNLQGYLIEEEVKMMKADAEWKKHAKAEDLKEMGDLQSGMASTIMQVYLKQVLDSFFNTPSSVRIAALGVIHLILRQGLIHPVQCVPYLISMGTDVECSIRVKADQQLQEIDKKYPGFIHMKALQGIKMSYKLHKIIQENPSEPIRGLRNMDELPQSLIAFLYTILRGSRQHRRGLLTSLLNLFDDSAKVSLDELLYIVDNLAFFPYQTQDEPLFIIHQIDIIVSVSGSNLLQSFKEGMLKNGEKPSDSKRKDTYDDDDDVEVEQILEQLPEDTQPLQEICRVSQGCIMLLVLKQHLKDVYGFTDSKIHRYSPSEAVKVYDKPISRKYAVKFNPVSVIDRLKDGDVKPLDQAGKRKLVEEYLDFKQLMLSIDPPDDDDTDENKSTGHSSPSLAKTRLDSGAGGKAGEQEPSACADGSLEKSEKMDEVQTPRTHTHHRTHRIHPLLEKKKKIRLHSSPKQTPKPPKKKTRKKRRRLSDSDDYDSSDDPDFVV